MKIAQRNGRGDRPRRRKRSLVAALLLSVVVSLGVVTTGVAARPALASLNCQQTLQPSSGGVIDFFHGTTLQYAQDIYSNGIDLSKSSPDSDFGRGFYVTTNLAQAIEWAYKQYYYAQPAIVEFWVPVSQLTPGQLCGQVFNGATSSYLNFVRSMRTNKPSTGGGGYDFVEGPLLLNPSQFLAGQAAITGGQQDSIHTAAAVADFDSDIVKYYQLSPTGDFPLTLRSVANGNFVSAEMGYTGSNYAMLRARAAVQGPWEQYTAYHISTNGDEIAIKNNNNGKFVSAELGYTGSNYAMLRARASSIGPWEKYLLVENTDGTISLFSEANDLYVSAELGYTGSNYAMLRARAGSIGPWETFSDGTWSTDCPTCE